MTPARNILKTIRKNPILTGVLALALGISGYLIADFLSEESVPPRFAWAIEQRQSGNELTWSEMQARLESTTTDDAVVIFNDMVVLADRTEPRGTAVNYRSQLNIIAQETLLNRLQDYEADVSYGRLPDKLDYLGLSSGLFMLVMLIFMSRLILTASGATGRKGPYALVKTSDLTQTLDDVAGLDSARSEIREVVALMKQSAKISSLGATTPKGLLLSGPPGTGKTLLARAMAKEAGLSFMTIDAAGLHQTFVGIGPSRVRKAFAMARENAPCIIFIDELDAVGSRSGGSGGNADVGQERANLINTFLMEMDGLAVNSGIFVVGATNHLDRIDPALIRPGRIDRRISIGLPDRKGREDILKAHCKKLPLDPSVDLSALAGTTPGMSGADLAMMTNEAAIGAASDKADALHPRHFAAARERMMLGQTGSAIVLSHEEREITAWHEAGHAVAAATIEGADPIEQVSILPRGGSLGHVMQVPQRDRYMETKRRMLDRMTILAAGRAAEVHRFGADSATTGAAADIQMLTSIATSMVTKWGMGDAGFLFIECPTGSGHSASTALEIRRLADEALASAEKILVDHKGALRAIAECLLREDTMSGHAVVGIIGSRTTKSERCAA